jgi:cytochrome c553
LKLIVVFTVVIAALGIARAADSPGPPLDSIDQRMEACAPCHGKEGRATNDGYYPRIAGKPAGYLYNQLLNFRDGRRQFPQMQYFTERQNESYLREIAAYFASQHLPYPAPQVSKVDSTGLARGRVLVTQGDPEKQIPACSACHGERLMGVAPAVPGLVGLSHDYLVGQLGAWRNGSRRAQTPDCMADIVLHMNQQDVAAATAWLASQSVPDDAAPENDFAKPPPIACGSIRNAEPAP